MINDCLHINLYKHIKDNSIGKLLREKYDNGEIKDEEDPMDQTHQISFHTLKALDCLAFERSENVNE